MIKKEDIVNWLKEGQKRGYTLDMLRDRLLERNIDAGLINAAVREISSEKKILRPDISPGFKKMGKTRWMRVAAIIGLIFFILGILGEISGFIFGEQAAGVSYQLTGAWSIVGILIMLVVIVLIELYLFGFVKMGQRTESRALTFSSWTMIILVPLFIIVTIVGGILTIAALRTGFNTFSYVMVGLIGLLLILGLIMKFVFSLGLIKAGGRVKFAKAAGIFGVIAVILSVISIGFAIYFVMNPSVFLAFVFSESMPMVNLVYQIVTYLVMDFVFLFEILALFDASKKFE